MVVSPGLAFAVNLVYVVLGTTPYNCNFPLLYSTLLLAVIPFSAIRKGEFFSPCKVILILLVNCYVAVPAVIFPYLIQIFPAYKLVYSRLELNTRFPSIVRELK